MLNYQRVYVCCWLRCSCWANLIGRLRCYDGFCMKFGNTLGPDFMILIRWAALLELPFGHSQADGRSTFSTCILSPRSSEYTLKMWFRSLPKPSDVGLTWFQRRSLRACFMVSCQLKWICWDNQKRTGMDHQLIHSSLCACRQFLPISIFWVKLCNLRTRPANRLHWESHERSLIWDREYHTLSRW